MVQLGNSLGYILDTQRVSFGFSLGILCISKGRLYTNPVANIVQLVVKAKLLFMV